jgi:ketosteroid isomerase-like protein
MPITERRLAAQEAIFARAFASGDLGMARPLYHPRVVYVSPTVRLFGWPARIEGVARTLEFIGLTVRRLEAVRYRPVETAIVAGGAAAFVRVHFDWTRDGRRLRSRYVVIYRYRDRRIARQELYYDPSGELEELTPAARAPAGGPGTSRRRRRGAPRRRP